MIECDREDLVDRKTGGFGGQERLSRIRVENRHTRLLGTRIQYCIEHTEYRTRLKKQVTLNFSGADRGCQGTMYLGTHAVPAVELLSLYRLNPNLDCIHPSFAAQRVTF